MSEYQAWMAPPPVESEMDPPVYDSDDDMKKEIRALTESRNQLEQELILKSHECNRLRLGLCECGRKCRPPNIMCNTCVEINAKQKRNEKIQLRIRQAQEVEQKKRDEKIQLQEIAQQAQRNRYHLAIEAARAQRAAEAPRGSIYRQPHIYLCICGQDRREKDMWCRSCATQRNNAHIIAQKPERDRIMKELRMSKMMSAAAAGASFIPTSEREPMTPVFTHESI